MWLTLLYLIQNQKMALEVVYPIFAMYIITCYNTYASIRYMLIYFPIFGKSKISRARVLVLCVCDVFFCIISLFWGVCWCWQDFWDCVCRQSYIGRPEGCGVILSHLVKVLIDTQSVRGPKTLYCRLTALIACTETPDTYLSSLFGIASIQCGALMWSNWIFLRVNFTCYRWH